MANNPPVQEIRLGRIKGLVWKNETPAGARFSITITQLYKDGDTWKETTSYDLRELPLVAKVADKAHTWVFEELAAKKG
jgi:hypothetical protein